MYTKQSLEFCEPKHLAFLPFTITHFNSIFGPSVDWFQPIRLRPCGRQDSFPHISVTAQITLSSAILHLSLNDVNCFCCVHGTRCWIDHLMHFMFPKTIHIQLQTNFHVCLTFRHRESSI